MASKADSIQGKIVGCSILLEALAKSIIMVVRKIPLRERRGIQQRAKLLTMSILFLHSSWKQAGGKETKDGSEWLAWQQDEENRRAHGRVGALPGVWTYRHLRLLKRSKRGSGWAPMFQSPGIYCHS